MKKNMTRNRKFNRKRFAAAAGAGLTAAAVLITGVLGRSIEAEAADTLIGIERLRTRVKESGEEYVILEIVPDGAASEIGFLFKDYEPILSVWDQETGEWKSWKEALVEYTDRNERIDFVEGKKNELRKYYTKAEWDDNARPVEFSDEEYDDRDEPEEGFDEVITAGEYSLTGWFVDADDGSEDNRRYQVIFGLQQVYTEGTEIDSSYVYYEVDPDEVKEVKWEGEETNVSDIDLVYIKTVGPGGSDMYEYLGTGADVKSGAVTFSMDKIGNGLKPGGEKDAKDKGDVEDEEDEDEEIEGEEEGTEGDVDGEGEGDTEVEGDDEGDTEEEGDDGDDDTEEEDDGEDDDAEAEGDEDDNKEDEEDEEGIDLSSAASITQRNWVKLVEVSNLGEDEDSGTDEDEDSDPDGDEDSDTDGDEDPNSDDGEDPELDEGEDSVMPLDDDEDEEDEDEDEEDGEEQYVYLVSFNKVNISDMEDGNIYYKVLEITADNTYGEYMFYVWDEETDSGEDCQEYDFPGITLYCKNAFTSNEWFRKYVLNMEEEDYEDFPVKVITLTPAELNAMASDPDKDLPAFDFLYLNSGLRTHEIEIEDSQNEDGFEKAKISIKNKADNKNENLNEEQNGDDDLVDDDEENLDDSSEDGTDVGSAGNTGSSTVAGDDETDNEGDSDNNSSSEDEPQGEPSDETDNLSASVGVNQGTWVKMVEDGTDPEYSISTMLPDETSAYAVDGDEEQEPGDNNDRPNGDGEDEIPASYVVEENDLSEDVLVYLYDMAIAEAKPCLVDGSILYVRGEGNAEDVSGGIEPNEELQDTNIFKLAAMLCQDTPSEWYESHRNNYAELTAEELMDGIVEDADKNFVVEHVYCRFGDGDDSIINDLFSTATIYHQEGDEVGEIQEGFQNVLDEILLENLYREADSSGNYKSLPTDISQATAVRHILNFYNRRKVSTKENIKVLEIQPAKADKPELTLDQLKKWAPGVKDAEITVMTTAEFIGKIEKLNENYDLIYIGTSKDHLNMRYWYNPDNHTGKPDANHPAAGTVFNDFSMDGLIYYNIGDVRGASMMLAGQLDSEYVGARNDSVYQNNLLYYNYFRYGGNDITEEKKDALLSFLDGSYPIVVADDFFESPVTVYATPGYKDGRVNLPVGEYKNVDLQALGIGTGDISSFKVKEGYQITLYNGGALEENAANRYHKSFIDDESDLNQIPYDGGGNWNNKTNSLKVERIEDATPVRTIDEDHIDNCTYMYEFVKEAMRKNYVNFYAWSDITDESELFKFYLNRPKVSLTDFAANGRQREDSGSDVRYIEAGSNGRYNLQYSFVIKNEGAASANTRYQCKLYIDINSDGKFSEQEEISDISMTQGGGYVSSDNLYADRTYMLSREVPSGYKGLLPWKVEITQVDNKNIYTSVQGYTKLEGMEPEQIKVIQIGRDTLDVGWFDWGNEPLFDLSYEIETDGRAFHELVYGGEYEGDYGLETFGGITDDFSIDVTFLTIPQFEEEFKNNPDYLDDFNMLILGFSDVYADFSVDTKEDGSLGGAMGAIVDFVNSGKSVLFAHDTTSFFNYPKGNGRGQTAESNGYGYPYNNSTADPATHGDYHFAYTLNKYLRNLVGMDRYGVLASDILRRGNALKKGDGDFEQIVNPELWRYDVAYKPKSGKTETLPQVHGYTYISINGKDQEHSSGNDRKVFNWWNLDTTEYGQAVQEIVNNEERKSFTNFYTNIRYDQVFYKGNTSDYGEALNPRNGEIDNAYVTQVNKGQITEYPYQLRDNFRVAETHGQYYQLDYTADDDGDGESDLVVWYCLDKRGNQETIYSQSPNDVRNNYYIYNKGNITYTGMGHRANDMNNRYTLEEAKLFINTIIAAYQAGVKDPYISVLKTGTQGSEELKTLYRYYDPVYDFSLDDLVKGKDTYDDGQQTYEKVYFTVQDINFIKGSRTIATHVYYGTEGSSETIIVDGDEIPVTRLEDRGRVFRATDGSPADAENLESGGIYYILVPRAVLQQCENGLQLYFEAQSTLTTSTTNENVYVTDKVYAKLNVVQAYLFNLE